MKVDQQELGSLINKVDELERENFEFAVGFQVKNDNVLPMFCIEGLGTIPTPVTIKVLPFQIKLKHWKVIQFNISGC